MPYPDFPQFSTPSSPAVPQLNVRRWVQHFDEPSSIFHAMGMAVLTEKSHTRRSQRGCEGLNRRHIDASQATLEIACASSNFACAEI
ncbi:hypothetical protein AnigIFM50267_010343 [Aspergillus niger]|nr:hypothetical protein AnigIFM50267_010343 [Aspergillus niger]